MALTLVVSCAEEGLPKLEQGEFTLDQIAIRDPFIYADESTQTYYLYGATRLESDRPRGRHGVKVYSSSDLKTWVGPKLVFETPEESWADCTHGVWAPEMHPYMGKYYLFATFTNENDELEQVEGRPRVMRRATQILVSDTPDGEFKPIGENRQTTPQEWMSLDGTLWVEDGKPYMIFCHEWIQTTNGTMEYAELSEDLSHFVSEPKTQFKALDAEWVISLDSYKNEPIEGYITDGCFLHRLPSGRLVMLWSSFGEDGYAVSTAVSSNDKLSGEWSHRKEPLYREHGGHPMLFKTFDGRLMMSLHYPNGGAEPHTRLFELTETENDLEIKEEFIP